MAESRRSRILIVESDPFLATTLAAAIRRGLGPESIVVSRQTLQDGMKCAAHEEFSAVVVDNELSDGQGRGLIRYLARRTGPPQGLFLLSGADPDSIQVGSLLREHPEIRFIEKPCRYVDVARQVREVVQPSKATDQTFYGLRLFDLIQAFSMVRASITLRVLLPDGKLGTVALREGTLLHAAMDGVEGMEALARMARDGRGEVRVEPGCTTAKHTIELPTQQALIEVFRILDERALERPQRTPTPVDFGEMEKEIEEFFSKAFDAE